MPGTELRASPKSVGRMSWKSFRSPEGFGCRRSGSCLRLVGGEGRGREGGRAEEPWCEGEAHAGSADAATFWGHFWGRASGRPGKDGQSLEQPSLRAGCLSADRPRLLWRCWEGVMGVWARERFETDEHLQAAGAEAASGSQEGTSQLCLPAAMAGLLCSDSREAQPTLPQGRLCGVYAESKQLERST